MSETYNPRERTFIKAPEIKMCPTCGHAMTPDVKPMTNVMNRYINAETGNIVTVNSGEPTIVQSGVTLYRCEHERNHDGKWHSKLVPKAGAPSHQTVEGEKPKGPVSVTIKSPIIQPHPVQQVAVSGMSEAAKQAQTPEVVPPNTPQIVSPNVISTEKAPAGSVIINPPTPAK